MDTVLGNDTITHIYTEYEWANKFPITDPMVGLALTEYRAKGVEECTEAGKRFFCVLTKPDDVLLDNDAKPKNVITVDTWKWRAQEEAGRYAGVSKHLYVPMLAVIASMADKAQYHAGILGIQIRGYPLINFDIPDYLQTLFGHLPAVEYSTGIILSEDDLQYMHLFFAEVAVLQRLKHTNG